MMFDQGLFGFSFGIVRRDTNGTTGRKYVFIRPFGCDQGKCEG